uniref:Uncharacterized LOC105928197 n=2 Tax=Fundulus heteroclitus TaxID=8078 RepID=A0A3Q2PCF0_FUNHE
MFVCIQHFHSGKPDHESQGSDTDWAPSLHLEHTQVKATTPEVAGVDSISAAVILNDHDYCLSPSDGERSLDCQSPDSVPSEFVYTKENEGPEEKMKRVDQPFLLKRGSEDDQDSLLPHKKQRSLAKKLSDKERDKTRISIGPAFPRWRELREQKQLQFDWQLAFFFLDRYQWERRRENWVSKPLFQPSHDPPEHLLNCSAEHCPGTSRAKENIPVPKKANDEPHQSHRQLQAEYGYLRQELDALQAENQMLKEELEKSKFSYANVKCNARQLLFFTGFTSVIFHWLLTKINDSVERISQKLSQEDHLLVVLMKLRLGLNNTDLAYRFNESTTTISNIIRSWIPTMAIILRPLIKWPSREAIRRNMPDIFDPNFTKCRCIVDFAEISIARPSNLTARAQTWSTYKHNNTIKYLIAFTPAGAISFLSPGWGGQVSDRQITYDSGFLGRLEPRDQIIAERVFQIRSELAAQGATFRIPHFARRKKQLSAHELETSRQLSRVRIHVERVLGRWKDFKILQSVIPLSQVDMLDDVVVLCSALTNLCKSVVPKSKQ